MKLLQLVNRTILGLVILVCLSFSTKKKNDNGFSNIKYIIIKYTDTDSTHRTLDSIKESCLGHRFIFLHEIINHHLVLSNGEQIWQVIEKDNTNTIGLGLNENPTRPNPIPCKNLSFRYISNPTPTIHILPSHPNATFQN